MNNTLFNIFCKIVPTTKGSVVHVRRWGSDFILIYARDVLAKMFNSNIRSLLHTTTTTCNCIIFQLPVILHVGYTRHIIGMNQTETIGRWCLARNFKKKSFFKAGMVYIYDMKHYFKHEWISIKTFKSFALNYIYI